MFRISFPFILFSVLGLACSGAARAQDDLPLADQDTVAIEEPDTTGTSEPCDCMTTYDDACDGCCECGGCKRAYGDCHVDKPLHYPYFPALHGYYYFRPYNYIHLSQQQTIVAAWGEDPRLPYANAIFQTVYAEYKADRK